VEYSLRKSWSSISGVQPKKELELYQWSTVRKRTGCQWCLVRKMTGSSTSGVLSRKGQGALSVENSLTRSWSSISGVQPKKELELYQWRTA